MRNRRDPLDDPALSKLLDALTTDPASDQVQGEGPALAAYRAVSWGRARRWHRPAILATKLGVATSAGVLALSGVATAAYTGSLPDTLQDVAHRTIKAPPAHAVGPDASGPAAHGLCQAFAKDKDDAAKEQRKAAERATERAAERAAEGSSPKALPPGQAKRQHSAPGKGKSQAGERGQGRQGSVAYRNLVRAAGGEDKVEAYCAGVAKLSGSAEPKAEKSEQAEKSEKGEAGRATTKPSHPSSERSATATPAPLPAETSMGSAEPTPTSEATESAAP